MTLYFRWQKLLFSCFLVFLFSFSVAHAQTAGTWDSRAAVPAAVSATANKLVYPGSGDLIYQRNGGDNTFNSYSISGNSWSALASDNCGAGTGDGSFLVRGDSGFLYAACPGVATDFVRYSISGEIWESMAASPSGFGNGASAVWDGSDYIYALAGSSGPSFYRYTISTNTWSDPDVADAPAGITGGGALAYPGSGDFIYALRGGDTATFYRYSISGDSWTAFTPDVAPDTVGGGGLVAADTSTIYAFPGVSGAINSTNFWSYSISGNSWTSLTGAPAAGGSGASLTYVSDSSGTFIYALRADSTTDFNRYTISLAASTGGSAGSAFLLARQDTGLTLARATRPASPTNVIVKPTSCNDTCGATITFSYSALSVHRGRPLTFAFIDESGKTLGSIYEPYANGKSYTMELKNLPPNSPLNGQLCAQFSPGAGCVNVQGWTLWALDAAKVKLSSAPEGDRYRARLAIPPFVNEGVEQSGVRVAIEKNGATKPVSVKNGRAPVAALAQVISTIGARETITQTAPLLNTAIVAPAPSVARSAPRTTLDVISVLPTIQAAPKAVNGGALAPSTVAPAPVAEKFPGTFLSKSGEWQVVLAPGEYRIVLTPVNGKGVSGAPLMLPLSLKPFGEAITLTAGMEAEDGVLRTTTDVTANRLGNTGIDIIAERKGGAFAFRPAEGPVEVRVSLVAALAKAEERFDFVFACAPGGGNCAVQSVAAQKGNIINRTAIAKNGDGFVTVKTDDAIATVRVTEAVTQASVSVTGTLQRLSLTESVALGALSGGAGTLSVTATDALGNRAAIRDVALNIPGGEEAEIKAFTVTPVGEEGDMEARAEIDYGNLNERGLLLHLTLAEEGLGGLGALEVNPKSITLIATGSDGVGVRMVIDCAVECMVGEAETVVPGGEVGEALEPAFEETPDGVAQYSAGGLTVAFDAQSPLPLLLSAEAGERVFSRVELRVALPTVGLGSFSAELTANEAKATASFFGSGKYVNLFPEVSLRPLLDLLPTLVYYPTLQTAPPIIEHVEGSRVVSQSRPVLREAAEIGAPVSPLLNAIQNLFGAGQ